MNRAVCVRILFWSSFCFLLACSRATQNYSQQDLEAYLRQKIAVAYADFELATDALGTTITEQCSGGMAVEGRAVIQESWKNSNAAWQRAQIINFGAIAEQNRAHDIAFYPSSRANLEKRVAALLQADSAITPESLNAGGVSLRGLPAMEYLLFAGLAAEQDTLSERTCSYLAALATLLNGHAAHLAVQWNNGNTGTSKSADSPASAFLEILLNSINERLSVIVAIKLEKSLEGSVDSLESPYSQQSLENIANNLAFVRALYGNHETDGILRYLAVHQHEDIAKEMSIRLNLVESHLDQLGADFKALQSDPEGNEKLRTVAQLFRSVQEYHATRIADALGVYIGFNAADGD